MRQEARADAVNLVHFYGAFAGYVDAWLATAMEHIREAAPKPATDSAGARERRKAGEPLT